MTIPRRRLLVALSGGVDSSTAAALLAESGESLVGVFMRNGVAGAAAARSCCSLSDARDARAVADRLGMPFYALDLERPFSELIDAFARDYAAGLTPNPCVVCNNDLKFGELLQLADELECEAVVTGHYARMQDGRLLRAVDGLKDQSYLLHGLDARQRARSRFPLGELTKSQVRAHARRLGLAVADKQDSADICFVPGGDYRSVVRERLGHLGATGGLQDEHGRDLGEHEGVGAFTVGQRRGLGVALGHPAFVTSIDAGSGTVRVGRRQDLSQDQCQVLAVNWHADPPEAGARLLVQLRHHHRPEAVGVTPRPDGSAQVHFEQPSLDVTPGQYAVFYLGEQVVGGGRIAPPDTLPEEP